MPNVPLLFLECLAIERKHEHIKAEPSYTEGASLMILGWMLLGNHSHKASGWSSIWERVITFPPALTVTVRQRMSLLLKP